MNTITKTLSIATLVALLTSCGGGGGGNSTPITMNETQNTPPTVNAGADQSVEALSVVMLTGEASDADGDALSYQWSKDGVVLSTELSFEYVPSTEGTDTLTFTATDTQGASSSDSITITATITCDPLTTLLGEC